MVVIYFPLKPSSRGMGQYKPRTAGRPVLSDEGSTEKMRGVCTDRKMMASNEEYVQAPHCAQLLLSAQTCSCLTSPAQLPVPPLETKS